ncbi:hypothetical protein GCM10009799_03130 [Nocardiopsis rhodophaea]|uniref:Uncharacterized protein n=1 Tax=Nocardiopsis rhodophaea TaxID=280238 RepID=A0ABN2S6Q1_9ACTN
MTVIAEHRPVSVPEPRSPHDDHRTVDTSHLHFGELTVALAASDMPVLNDGAPVSVDQISQWARQGLIRLGEPLVTWMSYLTRARSAGGPVEWRHTREYRDIWGSDRREQIASNLAFRYLNFRPGPWPSGHQLAPREARVLRRFTARLDDGTRVFTGPADDAGTPVTTPWSHSGVSDVWQLPDEVIAVALAASDMPALAPGGGDEEVGTTHTAEGRIEDIAAWTRQGLERVGGELAAFVLAYRARDLNHSHHWNTMTSRARAEFTHIWGSDERQEQAWSLAYDGLDRLEVAVNPLPDELDIFHRTLIRTALGNHWLADRQWHL